MFNQRELKTTKPVVRSALSAEDTARQWLSELEDSRNVVDSDGLLWSLDLKVDEYPSQNELKYNVVDLSLSLSTSVDCEILIQTGTLDRAGDVRLIQLIGENRIELRMRPIKRQVNHYENIRTELALMLDSLRKSLRDRDMYDIKRQLLGRWLDQKQSFALRTQF